MTDKFVPKLTDAVAETLLIPLYMRAQLTKQHSPIIKDDSAVTIIEQMDYDFARFQQADMSLIGCGVRADYFDKYACHKISDVVANQKANRALAIVSIGCGLDDRYQRIAEQIGADSIHSPYIHFFEMDLPEVMTLRTTMQDASLLATRDNQTDITGSLLDKDWLIALLDKIKQIQSWQGLTVDFCFMLEGVLMYFEDVQVKQFFVTLADTLSQYKTEVYNGDFSKGNMSIGKVNLIFDTASPLMVKFSDKHDTISKTNTTFKWGVQNDTVLSEWDKRYQLQSSTYIMDLHPKLWTFKARLVRLIPPLRKASKILTYRLAE